MKAKSKKTEPASKTMLRLAVTGAIEKSKGPSTLQRFFAFFVPRRSDLTLETWQALEEKRGIYNRAPAERTHDRHFHGQC